jgi:lysozyme
MQRGNQIAIAGALSSALVAFIANWEGKRNEVYLDLVGVPTACYGSTGPEIKLGQKYTDAQCLQMLRDDITAHRAGVLECLQSPVNMNQLDAFTSLAFNIGVTAACNSSPMRLINEGRHVEACQAFMEYRGVWQRDAMGRKIPGTWKEIRGLKLRREAERLWCLTPSEGPRGASLFEFLRTAP